MAEATFARGWFDTAANIRSAFERHPVVPDLILKHATIIKPSDMAIPELSRVTYLLALASYGIKGLPMPSHDHLAAVSVGELVAPALPTTLFLPPDEANKAIKRRFLYLMNCTAPAMGNKTRAEFIRSFNNVAETAKDLLKIVEPISDKDLLKGRETHYVQFLGLTYPQDMSLSPIDVYAGMFIAVAKRGNVSEEFLDKIRRDMEYDMQHKCKLNAQIIHNIFHFYGHFIDASNAREMFTKWNDALPTHAIRLKVTLNDIMKTVLTAFIVVGRAMTKYPDFPWPKMNQLTSGELTNYKLAVIAVDGNAYYGFNRTLGPVRSVLYSSLAYVAKELLIRLNGESNLKNYAGWVKTPKNSPVIKVMLDTYVEMHHRRGPYFDPGLPTDDADV